MTVAGPVGPLSWGSLSRAAGVWGGMAGECSQLQHPDKRLEMFLCLVLRFSSFQSVLGTRH